MSSPRLDALRHAFASRGIDALVVTHLPHVRYLTGFSGSNALLLITPRGAWLATDGRYAEQVRREVRAVHSLVVSGPLADAMVQRARLHRRARIGFDADRTSVAALARWKRSFASVGAGAGRRWVQAGGLLDAQLLVKDKEELRTIREAIAISERVLAKVLLMVRPGVREEEIAARISSLHRLEGAEADAFEPIVASGPRGALPHARATSRKLRRGEFVTIDLGCRVRGYHSDLTRTVSLGRPSPMLRRMYDAVLEAQSAAIAAICDGVEGRSVDAAARAVLKRRRLGPRFTHSLGHGLGLQVHELPRLAPRSTDVLRTGEVATVEPGVYRPGIGGVRIEDDILVRRDGCEILTTAPRELLLL